jgi:hypothetical protein
MDEKRFVVARFYAKLASIPSLEALGAEERFGEMIDLMNDIQAAFPSVFARLSDEVRDRALKKGSTPMDAQLKVWGERMTAIERVLVPLHKWVRELIGGLLEGKEVSPPVRTLPVPVWQLQGGELRERWNQPSPTQELLGYLVELLHQKPFPFKTCSWCKTIFASETKTKVYCSGNCAYESATKGKREERKQYMRGYMARYRKKASKAGRKRQKQTQTTVRKEH